MILHSIKKRYEHMLWFVYVYLESNLVSHFYQQ